MRTSAPSAFASNRLFADPGTRNMSPNEQKIASGRFAIATALSINSMGVTQTGHPGPWTSVISFGNKSSSPLLTIVWVCPLQISMTVHGRVTFWRIAAASCSAAFWSRYSLRNFTEFLLQRAHLFEQFEDALGLFFVDHADRESHVDQNIFSDLGLRSIGEVDFFADASEVDFADTKRNIYSVGNLNNAAWDGKTHERIPVSIFQSFNDEPLTVAPASRRLSRGRPARAVTKNRSHSF